MLIPSIVNSGVLVGDVQSSSLKYVFHTNGPNSLDTTALKKDEDRTYLRHLEASSR
jgi:hypothetical protein